MSSERMVIDYRGSQIILCLLNISETRADVDGGAVGPDNKALLRGGGHCLSAIDRNPVPAFEDIT